jgi:hypothetical protein
LIAATCPRKQEWQPLVYKKVVVVAIGKAETVPTEAVLVIFDICRY